MSLNLKGIEIFKGIIMKNKLLYIISMPGIILSNLVVSVILQYIFDFGMKKNLSFVSLLEIVAISLIVMAAICALSVVAEYAKSKLVQNETCMLRKKVLNHVLFYANKGDKEVDSTFYKNITTDCAMLEDKYYYPKFEIFENILIFILSCAYVIYICQYMLISIFVCSLPLFIVPRLMGKRYSKANEELSMQNGEVAKEFNETLRGVKVIKEYHSEKFMANKNIKQFNLLARFMVKAKTIQGTADNVTFFLSVMAYLGNQIVAIYFFSNGIISLGQAIALVQLTNSVVNPIRDIVKSYNNIVSIKSLKNRLFKLKSDEIISINKNRVFKHCQINDLIFAIKERKILDKISLQINSGDKILLAGVNGSGKSTLCKAISGYLEADHMEVEIDGKAANSINEISTYIDQEGYVFNLSLKDNILLGEEEDVDKLEKVINLVDLREFVNQRGFAYECGKNGENLSGGEKQKIQLARALYRDKTFLILDESFSAVDIKSRERIEKELYKMNNLTILEISHQMTAEIEANFDYTFMIEGKGVNVYQELSLNH